MWWTKESNWKNGFSLSGSTSSKIFVLTFSARTRRATSVDSPILSYFPLSGLYCKVDSLQRAEHIAICRRQGNWAGNSSCKTYQQCHSTILILTICQGVAKWMLGQNFLIGFEKVYTWISDNINIITTD